MSNTNEFSDFLTLTEDDASNRVFFEPLEDGLYPASCAAIILKEMQNYDKTGLETKLIFVFQIEIEDGKFRYIQSKPMTKTVGEKSNLWKLISKWTKQKDLKTLVKKMGTGGKFKIDYFLGKPIQLTIGQDVKGEKVYSQIEGYLAPKKPAPPLKADSTMPTFMLKNSLTCIFAEGISTSAPKSDNVETNVTEPKAEEAGEEEESELPF